MNNGFQEDVRDIPFQTDKMWKSGIGPVLRSSHHSWCAAEPEEGDARTRLNQGLHFVRKHRGQARLKDSPLQMKTSKMFFQGERDNGLTGKQTLKLILKWLWNSRQKINISKKFMPECVWLCEYVCVLVCLYSSWQMTPSH